MGAASPGCVPAASDKERLVIALLPGITAIEPRVDPIRGGETRPESLSDTAGAHELHCGRWRVDGGFTSTIRIKNSLIVGRLEVTPVLYMANGTAYLLPPAHLPIPGVATVSVNAALAAAPPEIARHLSGFGSAALRYTYGTPGHVLDSIAILDLFRSLIFTYPFIGGAQSDDGLKTREGLWWRHEPEVRGFVSLANTRAQPVQVSLQGIGSQGTVFREERFELMPHGSVALDLDRLLDGLAGPERQSGGLRVQYTGREGDVIVSGGVVNEKIGYSANMPFWAGRHHQGEPEKITYATVGIMMGEADPAVGFPRGAQFTPYVVLRNTTPNPLKVKLGVNYTPDRKPVTRALPPVKLAPFETRYFASELLEAHGLRGVSGMINLSASFEGRHGVN